MAKQCTVCGSKIGWLGSSYDHGFGFILCESCESKYGVMRSTLLEEEYEKNFKFFEKVLTDPNTQNEVIDMFSNLRASFEKRKENHKTRLLEYERKKLEKYGGMLPAFEFVTVTGGMGSYENAVYVFSEKVIIQRKGGHAIHNLPSDITIYYKDVSAIQYAYNYGRARITFVVSGVAAGLATSSMQFGNGLSMGGATVDYFSDPCTIIFAMFKEEESKKHYDAIKRIYDTFRMKEKESRCDAPVIQQDSAVDKLKKMKELMDLGIISAEEYLEKRNKLLNEV